MKSVVQETEQVESGHTIQSSCFKSLTRNYPDRTKLYNFVERVLSKEDCSRSLVIIGLKETGGEKISEKVDEPFQQIEVEPRFEAVRIGRTSADKTRHIKILCG